MKYNSRSLSPLILFHFLSSSLSFLLQIFVKGNQFDHASSRNLLVFLIVCFPKAEKNSVAGSDPSPSVTGRANSSSNQISSPAGPGLLEDLCSDPKHSYLLLTRDDSTMVSFT